MQTTYNTTGAGDFELVVITNHTDLFVGETIILTCVGYGEPDVEITWSRNDQTLINSSLATITESNTSQGGRLLKQSFLQLCDVEMADSGSYICTVDIGHQDIDYNVNLEINRRKAFYQLLLYHYLDNSFSLQLLCI